jgi:hypothetical protein
MTSIEVSKYKDGKAIEHWNFMEMREVMKMMAPPASNNMNRTDTSKK